MFRIAGFHSVFARPMTMGTVSIFEEETDLMKSLRFAAAAYSNSAPLVACLKS